MPDYKKINDGVSAYVDGKFVYLKIATDPAKAKTSGGGKMKLTASTGGFKTFEEIDGFRLNVMGGYKI